MTHDEMMTNLKLVQDFIGNRAKMAGVGDGAMLLYSWVRALDMAIYELETKPRVPRLLTEADFHRADADGDVGIPCWKETKSPTRRNGWAVIVYGKWLADMGVARYWTGKPTDEQMAEVKWE